MTKNKVILILFLILLIAILTFPKTGKSEVVLIPSDYADYSYSDAEHFKDTGQMKDETYSDSVHREMFLEEDMELEGYFADEYEND